MRHLLRVLSVSFLVVLHTCALARADTPTNSDTDCLSLRDGDVLYGKLLGIESGSVRWQHPDAVEPMDFKLASIAQIDFAPRPSAAARPPAPCKLWLANGDALEGSVVSCEGDGLTFDTWFAGKLKVARRSLQTLTFTPRTPIVFDGITGLDGWTEGSSARAFLGEAGRWLYRNGAFYSDKSSSIARDLKLPDKSELQFDMAWKGPLGLAIALYTDSLQPINLQDKENGPDFGSFYSLRFQNTVFVTLTPIRKKDPLRAMGDPLIIQSLTQKDRVHVDIRMSKPDHRVSLFLDGTLVKDWIDSAGFAGDGTGVRFVNNQISGGAIKISNIRVSKWNGVLEDSSTDAADPSHDVVLLESGAKISGAVKSIDASGIAMMTTGGSTNVPLDRASAIEFARFQGQVPAAAASNAHATFVQGGSVTFDLQSWHPDGGVAASPDLGRVKFDPAAFRHLQFPALEPK